MTLCHAQSSIKRILDVLQDEWDAEAPLTPPPSRPGTGATAPSRPATGSSRPSPTTTLTDEHRRIRMRLSPLLSVESVLNRKLLPESYDRIHGRDLCVPAGNGWKSILEGAIAPKKSSQRPASKVVEMSGRPATSENKNPDDPTMILAACKDDIVSLWEDPIVRSLLEKHHVRLEHEPGL
jgi:guanine nucleotide-binding protein alpha-1 subunit